MKLKLEKTKLADEYGRPIHFYHTTNVPEEIRRFHPLTHFGTQKAAQMRGISLAYKILKYPEPFPLPDEISGDIQQELDEKYPDYLKIYQVYLYMKSPIEIFDLGNHDLSDYKRWFLFHYSPKSIYLTPRECQERDGVGVHKMAYKKALTEFIFENPQTRSEDELKKELKAETLFVSDTKSLAKQVAFQRMIRYLETEGHDGFVYKNDCEDNGQKSYIIFRPEQVFQKAETEHEIPPISKENTQYLNQIEEEFFRARGFIPPYQRKELNRQFRVKSFSKTK